MTEPTVAERPSPPMGRRVLQAVLSLVVVLAIFVFVIPKIASYDDVWTAIKAMTALEVGTLLLVAGWNLATYWFVLMAVLPGLRLPQAAVANQASTAIANTVPGGGALGVGVTFAIYTSWGFDKAAITLSVLISGIWNNFAKLGFPIIALALLALEGDANVALVLASLAGVAMLVAVIVAFGLVLRSEQLARKVGNVVGAAATALRRLIRKPPVTGIDDAAVGFREQAVGLLHRRWLRLTVVTLLSHGSLFVVLLVALRHVGVSNGDVSWAQVLAAFAFVRLISALPITPGGLAVVELGLVAALAVGVDDAVRDEIVAAVLVFRFLTFFLPVPFGAAAYVTWRRNKSWRTDLAPF